MEEFTAIGNGLKTARLDFYALMAGNH